MELTKKIILKILFGSTLMVILSACAATSPSNVGLTALKKETIAIGGQTANDGQWQTNDMSVSYLIDNSADTFSISGTVRILESVVASFPMAEDFYLYITFVDKNGTGLSTHDISPLVRFRAQVPEKLNFRKSLVKPAGTESFAFSYRGTFLSGFGSEKTADGWDIFYRPFTKAP